MKKMIDKYLRTWDGPLTADLKLNKSDLGIGQIPEKNIPDYTVDSICGFCGTGCSLRIHVKNGEAVNLSPNELYPVNKGMACPKGWEALTPLNSKNRATTPLLRKKGKLVPVSWDEAITVFLDKLKETKEKYSEDVLAFLSTGQIATEEMAFLGALAKFGLGFVHGDGNTRQCMATAVTAYKQSFGFDSPPFTYADFELSDTLIFIGANPCIAHPIMWQRVMENKNNPNIIVIDPRKTETAVAANQHLAILPKSDLILFYYVAKILIEKKHIDQKFIDAHTTGFPEFSKHVAGITETEVLNASGLSKSEIDSFIESIYKGKRVSFWWTMGVNQSYEGTRVAQAIINLALMTGNIGKPGTGPNSITGQCNAMGSRLFSNTTSLIGGHNFTSEKDRNKVSSILNIDINNIPSKNCKAYNEIIQSIEEGDMKFLWLIATNTVHSWPDKNYFKSIRKNLDFLVVQDMYNNTESAQMADLVLPAAGWGEKTGTFINSERRIGLIQKVRKSPGQALSDFNIFKLIAGYAAPEMFDAWKTPQDVFHIMKQLTEGQPCEITGISGYQILDEAGGIQWPLKKEEEPTASERRLFANGEFFHPDKRAKFIFDVVSPKPELPSDEYPLVLLTGRGSSSQWHTQTRSSQSDILNKLYPESIYCEINPFDAEKLGVQSEDLIEVSSKRGSLISSALIMNTVAKGQVFIPMHYNEVNNLTLGVFDPHSKQPSTKYAVVNIKKV